MDKPAKKVTRKTATTKRKAPATKAPAKRKAAPAKRTPSTTTTKKRELVKRKKRLNVSVVEQGLLLHPPTKVTWACSCGIYNGGRQEKCWLCGKPKTDKLLWPIYIAACEKVGVEIGSMWKIKNKINNHVMMRPAKGKWRDWSLPEGYDSL